MRSRAGSSKARRLALLPLLLVPLAVPALVSSSPAQATTAAISLPKDESPHPSSGMEWWYYNGHLTGVDPSGKVHRYGFLLSFIRINDGQEPASALYNGQFAITDLTRGAYEADMSEYAQQPDVVPPQGGYNITINGWNMNGINGQNNLTAAFKDGNYGINLTADQSKPAALHGNGGIIPYGPFGQSYYYSETDLHASGTLMDHGVPVKVTGSAWEDHQWGNFSTGTGGWTWFSVQLANDTQYMLYFIHDANGNLVQIVGTKVNPDGSTVNLDPSQISETPLGSWTSPTTHVTYPQNWLVKVPGGEFTVLAQQADQEPTALTPAGTYTGYWEGTSTVTGAVNGVPAIGQAYVEITPNFSYPVTLP
jgi:predicted secreted hydrolase